MKALKNVWSFVVRCALAVWAACVWLIAQITRAYISIEARKRFCDRCTTVASASVAKSYTVRVVYLVCTAFTLYKAMKTQSWTMFAVSISLVGVWSLAEFVWATVLYVAATIGEMDSKMEEARLATVDQVKKMMAAKPAPAAQAPVAVVVPNP